MRMPSESTQESGDAAAGDSSAAADRTARLSRRTYLAGIASLGATASWLATRADASAGPDEPPTAVQRTPTDTGYRLQTAWTYDDVRYSVTYQMPRDAYRWARAQQPTVYAGIFDHAQTAAVSQTVTRAVVEAARTSRVPRRLHDVESAVVELPTPASEPPRQVRELVAFEAVRSFLQSLPYGTDAATTDRIEYCRHVEETLVDGIGDCEDYTALAAGMFAQPPFEYDTVCIFLPDHITLGIKRRDLPQVIREGVPERGTLSVADAEYVFFDPVSDDQAGFDVEDADRVEAVYVDDGTWRNLQPTIMAQTLLQTGIKVATNVAVGL